eukprot:5955531-Prorocentrum_lima.AAC.1
MTSRDDVESRGLGDVYKRQALTSWPLRRHPGEVCEELAAMGWRCTVSYTHLTLPTICSV